MITVHKIYPKGFAANCYLLTADGKTAVAIDPAQPRVLEESQKYGLKVEYVLLTHGHFDHIGGCAALQNTGAKIGCLQAEKPLALGPENLAERFRTAVPPFQIDFTVNDGETLSLCGLEIKVIAASGHTAGGACYLVERALFTGDTLFFEAVGRCDLPTGSASDLEKSIRKLYALEGDYSVYAGHGEDTTLEYERSHNAFFK